jgi:hypothetical protein
MCHRKGHLEVYPESKNLIVERDELGLANYQFGGGIVSHKVGHLKKLMKSAMVTHIREQFCPRCGTGVMNTTDESSGGTDVGSMLVQQLSFFGAETIAWREGN